MSKPSYFFRVLWIVMGFLCLIGCNSGTRKNTSGNEKKVLAKAGGQALYWSEIADMIPRASSPADSVAFLKRYADGWVRKQLLLSRAIAETKGGASEIDKKVAEYREYLVLQAFEEQYVAKNTDTIIAESEITAYYRTNPENFALQQTIVRAWLVTVPKNTPSLERVRAWMQVNHARNKKELQSFAYRFANFYHLNDSVWIGLDELIRNTPFRDMNKAQVLKNNRFTETSDQQNVYLLTVKEYKLSSQAAPLAFIKPQIREILLHRRKVKMIHDLEKRIYEEGKQSEAFEILIK